MSLGKVPMKAGGGAKQKTSYEQGVQVSMPTKRAATTTRHRHTDKVSGDTYQPHYSPRPPKREWREGQTAAQSTIRNMKELHNLTQRVRVIWRWAKTPYVKYTCIIRDHRWPALARF